MIKAMYSGWILYAVAALLMWGLAGFLAKFASNKIDPHSLMLYQILGMVAVGVGIVFFLNFDRITFEFAGASFGFLRGFLLASGTLLFLVAIDKGKASVVVPFTSLYPLVTVALAMFILGEVITLKQGIGVGLAAVAVVLLSL